MREQGVRNSSLLNSWGPSETSPWLSGELTFFLNTPGRVKELDNSRGIILEFYFKERAAVDAKYTELTNAGYQSPQAPFVTPTGMYFAVVNDPDGNTIVLSAD